MVRETSPTACREGYASARWTNGIGPCWVTGWVVVVFWLWGGDDGDGSEDGGEDDEEC